MLGGIYQHFKQSLSQSICHTPVSREGRISMIRWEHHLVMQFRTAIHRYLSIKNTFNLSNPMSFTWSWVSQAKLDKRWTVKHKIPVIYQLYMGISLRETLSNAWTPNAFASRALIGWNLTICQTEISWWLLCWGFSVKHLMSFADSETQAYVLSEWQMTQIQRQFWKCYE